MTNLAWFPCSWCISMLHIAFLAKVSAGCQVVTATCWGSSCWQTSFWNPDHLVAPPSRHYTFWRQWAFLLSTFFDMTAILKDLHIGRQIGIAELVGRRLKIAQHPWSSFFMRVSPYFPLKKLKLGIKSTLQNTHIMLPFEHIWWCKLSLYSEEK